MHKARLIAKTVPVDPEFGTTANEFIAYVARVSNPGNQWNHKTADKLVAYLERERHWSPFEMFNIVIEINTTRDIARQLLRHHSLRFQEHSLRYATAQGEPVFREARLQDTKNRQNSIYTDDADLITDWLDMQTDVWDFAKQQYDWAIKNGIAKEVARAVLPEGLTPSRLYCNGSVRSWIHYLSARLDPSTQKEHRVLAGEVSRVVQGVLEG